MLFKKQLTFITNAGIALLLLVYISCNTAPSSSYDYTTWEQYGGGADQSKYFDATEITKENVNQMKLAWMYPAGDSLTNFFSPIVVDTMMYVVGKGFSLIAISAITGKEIWIHANLQGLTRRGLSFWESKNKKDKRILFMLNNSLQAIDAITGKSVMSFGNNGYVDLREGLNRDPLSIRRAQSNTPGVVFEDLIILGCSPGEGYFTPPGYVRAYNVITGKLEWTFHTIPHPGEFGYDTWPKDAYKYVGGVNAWGEMSLDEKRGIVYLPLGSPTYDYYGADRIGKNLFGNSLVALDALTGKRIWHYQTVHHDLWDYDLTSAPQLITVHRDGKKIDAVAVATKHGFIFVFDRANGEPVFPIEEKPFPASEMPGEEAWPTQPIPTVVPSFSRHEVTKETLNPYFSEEEKQKWYKRIDSAKSGLFIPPSDKYETMIVPGAVGGANFGNTASNPQKGIMYVMSQEYPSLYKLQKAGTTRPRLSANELEKIKTLYTTTCQSCHGENMRGGVGPSLVDIGQRVYFDEFKNIIADGRGQMPGFLHIDEQSVTALYRFLGGNPSYRPDFVRRNDTLLPEGPVVASGGAPMKPDAKRAAALSDYPKDVPHPQDRYTSGYGLGFGNLLAPPWAYITAYDLNTGTIKWRKPLGEEADALARNDKTTGAPIGSQRKSMIVTATGVVFATGKGGKLYAFDGDNGNILWETNLSHESNALISMYQVNGKQYLTINANGNFSGDSYDYAKEPGALPKGYLVFALPDKK